MHLKVLQRNFRNKRNHTNNLMKCGSRNLKVFKFLTHDTKTSFKIAMGHMGLSGIKWVLHILGNSFNINLLGC
jgi:hypothetical protein